MRYCYIAGVLLRLGQLFGGHRLLDVYILQECEDSSRSGILVHNRLRCPSNVSSWSAVFALIIQLIDVQNGHLAVLHVLFVV